MRAISFSLYGSGRLYVAGMAVNCHLAPRVYGPGWVVRIHHDDTVPRQALDYYASLPSVQLVDHTGDGLTDGQRMLWRFYDMDPQYGYTEMLSRDADSRTYLREKVAVDEWLGTDALAHSIRDSISHRCLDLCGGLCGFRCIFPDVAANIRRWLGVTPSRPMYGWDQEWLKQAILPIISESIMYHGRDGALSCYPAELTVPYDGWTDDAGNHHEGYHCGALDPPRTQAEIKEFGVDKLIEYCDGNMGGFKGGPLDTGQTPSAT